MVVGAVVEDGNSEFGCFNFGDKRLDKRCVELLSGFISKPFATIAATLRAPSAIKAAYRFFGNSSVTREKILEAHVKWTAQCCDYIMPPVPPQNPSQTMFTGNFIDLQPLR